MKTSVWLFVLAASAVSAQTLPLMPWPASVAAQTGSLPINSTFSIGTAGAGAADARVKAAIARTYTAVFRQTGIPVNGPGTTPAATPTLLVIVESGDHRMVESRDHRGAQRVGDNEQYSLTVSSSQAKLAADTPLGVLRGLETFLQLVAPGPTGYGVPAVAIHDQPRFPWRGLSLDVSRHFIPVQGVKRTIDGLAAVKLNVLHWHLSDDQGIRVESKKYPRLQQYGSDGLFYTQSEIRDIVGYARDRGVRIVPEFDVPGHATAFLPGYPSLGARKGPFELVHGTYATTGLLDPTKESTYRFLDGFIGEMVTLFPDEYFHIGGDEVDPKEWNANTAIQAFSRKHRIHNPEELQVYFNQRLLKIVTKHHKNMAGWDEVLQPSLPKSILIQSWRGQASLWQAAREGYSGILSAGYYLDLGYPASYHYSIDPMKIPTPTPGRKSEPAKNMTFDLTPAQQKLILGGEAAMWEEIASSENLDSRLWPRLAAIAERLWSRESVTDVHDMYSRLEATDIWLELAGLQDRSALRLMRQRLAGREDVRPLDSFAGVLEPTPGYSRHRHHYTIATPLNRLVDAVAPESETAREFNDAVDAYLAGPRSAESSAVLSRQLDEWLLATSAVRPLLQRNGLLEEILPLDDQVGTVCRAGQDALKHLATGQIMETVAVPTDAHAEMIVAITPGIQKLIDTATAPSH